MATSVMAVVTVSPLKRSGPENEVESDEANEELCDLSEYCWGCYERHEAGALAKWQACSRSGGGRPKVCKCGKCADCTQRAAVKKRKGNEWKAINRTVKKAAGDDGEQAKDTKARQEKRAANKKAGDDGDQAKDTKRRRMSCGGRGVPNIRNSGRATPPAKSSSNCSPTPRARGLPRTRGLSSSTRWAPPSTHASRRRSSVTSMSSSRWTLTRTHAVVASFSQRTSSRCERGQGANDAGANALGART